MPAARRSWWNRPSRFRRPVQLPEDEFYADAFTSEADINK
jgi:hypothetical protein